jgi:hypothetical protein
MTNAAAPPNTEPRTGALPEGLLMSYELVAFGGQSA